MNEPNDEEVFFLANRTNLYNQKKMQFHDPLSWDKKVSTNTPADPGRKRGTMETSKYLKEAELAKILKVSKSTLYKLREDGSLPFQMIGTCIRYAKPDLEKWLESNRFNVHEKEQL